MRDRERYEARVDRSGGPDACHDWIRPRPDGYGQITLASGTIPAHRYGWALERGPIPPGMQVDHLCGRKACQNTLHMQLATPSDHKLRHVRRDECRLGHPFAGVNLYVKPTGARVCRTCKNDQQRARRARLKGPTP